jgi:flagellar hook-associated protein 2
MAGISSLGIGSGLDLGGLVDNLVNAERAPVQNSLDRQQNRLTTELSGVGIFRGAISSFQSSLNGLGDASKYSTRSFTNSNNSALGVSVTNEAAVGSYDIDVTNLAENHSLASGAFTSLDEVVGEGTIQIRFGTITGPGFTSFSVDGQSTTQTLIIDSTNNTLSGLRDYINEGDFGVNASIINDGSGYRLTLTSKTSGENAAMEISVTDTGGGGLSRLDYNASSTQMTQTQAAEDAALLINGIAVTSSSNSLSDMIEGVTVNLLEETSGTPLTLKVAEDTSTISSSIKQVVDSYNVMVETLNELGQAGPEGTQSGILVGDSVLRNFTSRIRSLTTGTVPGLTGSITALSNIGIVTQADGKLGINDSTFSAAIAENPEGALALFAPVGSIDDNQVDFKAYTDNSVAGNYAVNITQLATQSQLSGAGGLTFPLTIDTDNDNLTLSIDGISTGNISLTQGSYASGADLATELQLQINSNSAIKDASLSVTVEYDAVSNGLVIRSDQYGSDSQVEITAIDTNTTTQLGLSVVAASVGVDVSGTIDGRIATGSGQVLTADTGDANGLSITVTGGTTGFRGNIQFSRGVIGSMDNLLTNFLDNDGILSTREKGINSSLEQIQEDRESLQFRLDSLRTRLVKQFSALDALIAQFQSTGNFLAQQIDALPGAGQLNKK